MSRMSQVSMSKTKDDLLRHLDLPLETYDRMAKEADQVYLWLTSEKSHLKKNCDKGKPPYDWSDMKEKSKDEAIERLAKSKDQYTSTYWNLAEPELGCPNWIARWFLYHKFRYRDGRNRNTGSAGSTTHRKRRSQGNDNAFGVHDYQPAEDSRHSVSAEECVDGKAYSADMRSNYTKTVAFFDQTGSMSSGTSVAQQTHMHMSIQLQNPTNTHPNQTDTHIYKYDADVNTHYAATHDYTPGYTAEYDNHTRSPNKYYDPVRDATGNTR